MKSKEKQPDRRQGNRTVVLFPKGFVRLYFFSLRCTIKKAQYLDRIAVVFGRRAATEQGYAG